MRVSLLIVFDGIKSRQTLSGGEIALIVRGLWGRLIFIFFSGGGGGVIVMAPIAAIAN